MIEPAAGAGAPLDASDANDFDIEHHIYRQDAVLN
jgi:hypothetical protein